MKGMVKRWILLAGLMSAGSVLAAPRAAPAPGEAADLAAQRREAADQLEQRLSSLPSIGAVPIEKIFQFSMEEGDLRVDTQMAPTTGPVRVQINGMKGDASLNLRAARIGRRGGGGEPSLYIQFRHDDVQHGDDALVTTQVLTGPHYVQIARGVESSGQSLNISLIQNLQMRQLMGMQGRDAVRLYVQGIDNQSGQSTVDLKLSAQNLADMLRQHPREMAEYVQPILRDLHQEAAIFTVEPAVAWQVFAPQLKGDPAMAAQVSRLIPNLGAPQAAQRSAAADSLHQLGAPGALQMMRLDRKKLSPEQNTRLDALLDAYRTLTPAEAAQLRDSPDFLPNCLSSDQRDIRAAALDRLKKKFPTLQFNLDADQPARQAAVAELRQKFLAPATQP
jgi:hypothetical protein